AFFHSRERIAPLNRGIKELEFFRSDLGMQFQKDQHALAGFLSPDLEVSHSLGPIYKACLLMQVWRVRDGTLREATFGCVLQGGIAVFMRWR
uniref:hypothetical protein n=1 Tax=Yoonia sp. TaxID=2212373 RepID=UPI0025D4DEF7